MRKIDIIFALVSGEGIAWLVLWFLGDRGTEISILSWTLPIFLPFFALFCLFISELIGKKFLFVFQLAKFLLVGILATLLDLGILNFLMWISGIEKGLLYTMFVGISFLLVTIGKYFGNKYWAFEKREAVEVGKEFSQFFAVTLGGLAIHMGVASFVVNIWGPQFGFSSLMWANVGKIFAAILGAIWNFLGYKFLVFKK